MQRSSIRLQPLIFTVYRSKAKDRTPPKLFLFCDRFFLAFYFCFYCGPSAQIRDQKCNKQLRNEPIDGFNQSVRCEVRHEAIAGGSVGGGGSLQTECNVIDMAISLNGFFDLRFASSKLTPKG